MSTEQIWQIESTSFEDTLKIAAQIGHKLRGGEVIELVGDVGSGKTSFVKGLVQGLGSADTVHSPSFTVTNQYQASGLTVYHFDFYRLSEPGIMHQELTEILDDRQAVIIVEWAMVVEDVLPPERLIISLATIDEKKRQLCCAYPDKFTYLFNT